MSGAVLPVHKMDCPKYLKSRRCRNEDLDKACDSCCGGRGLGRVVCLSTGAPCGQPDCERSISIWTRRPVGAVFGIRNLLQHFASDGRYGNHLSNGDGSRVLRLTSFRTSNGPDVHVYIVAADDARDVANVEKVGFVDLGVIKGNIGDQNYPLGSDLDLAKYRAVSIWCKRFSVNFGAAALRPAQTSQNQ